jgi:hypothetical protein
VILTGKESLEIKGLIHVQPGRAFLVTGCELLFYAIRVVSIDLRYRSFHCSLLPALVFSGLFSVGIVS